ncbi:MAG: ATP-binding protein [Ignavibacteriales bacterium]|nr:ATP-binding protein [Ignavibacteriales bacterium]
MNRNLLERVVNDQFESFRTRKSGIKRNIDLSKYLKSKQIIVITGVRRCGKSTLLKQISEFYKSFYYLNLDDERLIRFSVEDFDDLVLIWKKKQKSKVVLLDEIQNIKHWERFVRRLHDENYKIFITGSNAKLLSGELSTHLTGRHSRIELLPFSFEEYLRFRKYNYTESYKTTDNLSRLLKLTDEYIENGGFPEFLIYNDDEYLKRIYEDILYRDLITRFKIRESKSFRELANYLFTNFTSEVSYNALQRNLNFKSVVSVKNYIGYIQESYLIYQLFKYDFSLKKQLIYNKKIYVVDNGLRNQVAFRFSNDSGKLLENAVFLHLKNTGKEIYYFKNKKECDFIVKEKNKIITAIQATDVLTDANYEREIAGLLEAMNALNLKKGFIITRNQEERIKKEAKDIFVIPVYKWLLNAD